MEIEMEIDTDDHQLLNDLLENPSSPVQPGYQKRLSNGATITLKRDVKRRGFNIPPESITLVLSLGTSITTNILSTWLYEKLKGQFLGLSVLTIPKLDTLMKLTSNSSMIWPVSSLRLLRK